MTGPLRVRPPNHPSERQADALADRAVRQLPATGPALDHRAGGRALPEGVREGMESALGADFGRVRVHADDRAHELNVQLRARAFTVGNDVFFRRGQTSGGEGQRLLAHELGHVAQQGPSGSDGYVHRAPYGIQPAPNAPGGAGGMIQANDRDLLYGLGDTRQVALDNLAGPRAVNLRTVDDYNTALGITDTVTYPRAAMGLYRVRAALAAPAAAWPLAGRYAPGQDTGPNRMAVAQWMDLLKRNAGEIGLNDLGTRRRWKRNRIDKKGRFHKNLGEDPGMMSRRAPEQRLSPSDTRQFLAPENTLADAQRLYDAMDQQKKALLNAWVYAAFFRRTSKLGLEFAARQLGSRVFFNTRADPNFGGGAAVLRDRGLDEMAERKTAVNRSITESELRRARKIGRDIPNRIYEYGDV